MSVRGLVVKPGMSDDEARDLSVLFPHEIPCQCIVCVSKRELSRKMFNAIEAKCEQVVREMEKRSFPARAGGR
jgi:hypothetical protein